MRYLLDTHTLVWAVCDAKQLSPKVTTILESPKNIRLVSPVSIWEMSIKFAKGKWPEVESFLDEEQLQRDLSQLAAEELLISFRHTRLAGLFKQDHQDPFDRLLIAQAVLEGTPILSKDKSLDAFPVHRIW
jgi:PIN domain nuclease of toxin-antitoxin system